MSVTLYGRTGASDTALYAAAERETARLEGLFSDFLEGSALSAVRGRIGDTVRIDPEMRLVLARALEMGQASDGAFDITLHGLKALWGIGTGRTPRVPDSAAIDSAMRDNPAYHSPDGSPPAPPLALVGADRAVILRAGTPLDLGGIAKGYLVDRLDVLLDSLGSSGHLVQAGGEIRAGGRKPGGEWLVGIRHPRIPDSVCGILASSGPVAVSTSGDYERFFMQDGIRYHHLFDPRTGRPAAGVCAVTVVAGSGLLTDALTKPLFILGPAKGADLARRFGAKAVWFREGPQGVCAVPMPEMAGTLRLQGVSTCPQDGMGARSPERGPA